MGAVRMCIFELFLLMLLAARYECNEIDTLSLDKLKTEIKLKAYKVAMQERDEQIAKIQEQLHSLQAKVELFDLYSNENKQLIASMKSQLDSNTEALRIALNQIASFNSSIATHGSSTKSEHKALAEDQAMNCMPFQNSSDIHDIFVNGFGHLSVLCDAQIAGGGWLVVQRRFDGSVNFYRNWAEYKEGFGELEGEFFLGLESLFHLTKSLPHELYVRLVDFNNNVRHARYDNFMIGSEEEQYMLKSLGTYSGNAGNALAYNLHDSFTTYDQDNDGWSQGNCAVYYLSGWWYNLYGNSNLNGRYFDKQVHSEQSIWWYNWKGYYALKSVQMMIRPKYTSI